MLYDYSKARILLAAVSCLIYLAGCSREKVKPREWVEILPLASVSSMCEDNHYVWIGTNAGLIRYNVSSDDTTFLDTSRTHLPTINVLSMTVSPTGQKFFGTGKGLVKFDTSVITSYKPSDDPAANVIRAMDFDSDGNLWIGTNSGVLKFNGSGFTGYNKNSGLPDNGITSIAVGKNNDVWAGTWGYAAAKFNGSTWQIIDSNNSTLSSYYIFDIQKDRHGNIWIGEGGGVNRFGSTWKNYTVRNSPLPQSDATTIAFDHGNAAWIGTYEGGVAKFDDGDWLIYSLENAPFKTLEITKIFVDSRDRVWVGTPFGLYRLD